MKYISYLIGLWLFIFLNIFNVKGQNNNNIVPVSPEAAALAKSVNYPVNKNTGIPDISIPFYEIKVGKLTLPINLVYHGGGFKINEHATRMGLGWSLSSNLQITRTINGLDDFKPNVGYIGNTLMKTYDSSYPYDGSYFNQGDPQYWYRAEYDLAAGNRDGQPDKFNYSLLDKSGSFYFMKNASGKGYTIVPVPYNNIKITYDNGRFIIVDTDGTTYYFGEAGGGDLDAVLVKGKEVTGNIDAFGTCMNCKVTTWKCLRVESSVSTNAIIFTYEPKTKVTYRSYSDRIEYFDNESPCGLEWDGGYYHSDEYPLNTYNSYENILQNIPFYRISSPKYMVYYADGQPVFHVPSFDNSKNMTDKTYKKNNYSSQGNKMDIAGLALSKIEFRGGYVIFNGADKLISVDVKDNHNQIIKSAQFYQSYTNAFYTQEAQHYNGYDFQGTAYLDSLHIGNGGNTFQRYAFLYNDKFCYGNHLKGHDAWGYPNEATVEIAYANNTFGNILAIPSKRVMQGRYYFDLYGGCTNFIENIPIEIGEDNWAEAPDEEAMKKGTLKRIIYPTGGFVDFDWEANQYLEFFDNGYGYYQKLPQLGGGLRIRSISYFDGENLLPEMQEYYRYGEMEAGNGILINRPRQAPEAGTYYFDAVYYDQQIGYLEAPGGIPGCGNRNCLSVKAQETKTTYRPASSLNYTYENGAPIYYTKVTVYKKDLGIQSGKTVYDYYPPNEFMPLDAIHGRSNIPQTPLSYLNTDGFMGAKKSESQYAYNPVNGYQLIHRKTFEYDTYVKDQWIRVAYGFFHVLYEVVEGNYTNNDPSELYKGSFSSLESPIIFGQYGIAVGRLLLNKVTEETFEGENVLSKIQKYHYDNAGYFQPSMIEYFDSRGNPIVKTIKYPYNFTGVYDQMVADNIIDIPIEVTKVAGLLFDPDIEVSKKKTNYGYIPEGWGFFAPVSVETSSNGSSPVIKATFDQYDQYGNLLQRTLRNGIPTSYLWGYDGLYPVAKLESVKYDQIPSSFLSNVQITNPSSDGALRSLLSNLRGTFTGKPISTYTYKRLVGMTSETSSNEYITYYEYDPIGRLINQKDDNQHITKAYAYNMVGPTANSLYSGYVNYPTMETHNEDCGNGDYVAYNYIVPGGKYISSSQEMANYQAKNDAANVYNYPTPSPCSTIGEFATASLDLEGIYNTSLGYPSEVFIDLLQNGAVVASARVSFNHSPSQNYQSNTVYLPAGDYLVSLRPSADTHYTSSFLTVGFSAVDESYSEVLHSGDTIHLLENKRYEILITNIM